MSLLTRKRVLRRLYSNRVHGCLTVSAAGTVGMSKNSTTYFFVCHNYLVARGHYKTAQGVCGENFLELPGLF